MSDPNRDDRTSPSDPDAGDDPTERTPVETDSGTGADSGERMGQGGHEPRDESTAIASEERRRNTSFISGIVAVLGLWAVVSVLIYDVGGAITWNNVLVGAVVFAAAGYNYYRLSNDVPLSVGVASLVAVLGIWLIVSAALLEMIGGMFWSTLVTGLLVTGLSGYNAYEAREARAVTREPETSTQ
ncbi:SPW repeat protein [Natronobacterium gregoryi]|uniref:SPW repeat-containing integral membrane domain-containing protein n=2 Tax=Natronobacterium gregoryi TaxID=44930 RepID=L0AH79_NATGS|nr:SPW repeat protein [Natronobacterium gregoryi]AFZ73253.1 hypothetical protein Natgr_2070 [Natronobacterium gregoryi SP2]ELY71288.1 hypothetical protein C490_05137 [Natronobacterium gregoryi SP2]PLK21660.1 hypothetical protein CYV19_03630 [Natronobacterium gregoryi SP2]SFI57427.1 hypothetical protein SAMN05443661_10211 [Natronobacterium gregoryi]